MNASTFSDCMLGGGLIAVLIGAFHVFAGNADIGYFMLMLGALPLLFGGLSPQKDNYVMEGYI